MKTLTPQSSQAHLEALLKIKTALQEYASLHLTMASRILERGYITTE